MRIFLNKTEYLCERNDYMKKILGLLVAAAVSASMITGVSAESAEPSVKVNGRTVMFREEQAPVILNDRTYVPLRRVLEQMGAKVQWNGETKTVTVDSEDNIIRLVMTIDNPEITVYTFTSVLHADKSTVTSDVAPIIMNDRTMLPIRAVAEAMGATVKWDDSGVCADITTKTAKIYASQKGADTTADSFSLADSYKDSLPKLTLSGDSAEVKEGEDVTLKLKLSDLEKAGSDVKFCSTTVSIEYDAENFSYEGYKCINDGEEVSPALSADNPVFTDGCAKIITLFLPANAYVPGEDGTIMEIQFKSLNGKGGSFSISDGITSLGNNTELLVTAGGESNIKTLSRYDELYIDTAPVEIK